MTSQVHPHRDKGLISIETIRMQITQALRRASGSIRRLQLTTKQASKGGGYYKGTRTGPMGRHTKHGGYVLHWDKVRTYVVPAELSKCKVGFFGSLDMGCARC